MVEIPVSADLVWGLKNFFRYPEEEVFTANRNDILEVLKFAEKRGLIVEEIIAFARGEKTELTDIQVDFTRLFINGVPTVKAHPFAGWYRGDEIVFGESDRELMQFYSCYGFLYDQDSLLPADHIMVELEFIAIMLEEYKNTADEIYINGVKELVNKHMKVWIPDFLANIRIHARTRFYKEVADIVETFLNVLEERLEEVKLDG